MGLDGGGGSIWAGMDACSCRSASHRHSLDTLRDGLRRGRMGALSLHLALITLLPDPHPPPRSLCPPWGRWCIDAARAGVCASWANTQPVDRINTSPRGAATPLPRKRATICSNVAGSEPESPPIISLGRLNSLGYSAVPTHLRC